MCTASRSPLWHSQDSLSPLAHKGNIFRLGISSNSLMVLVQLTNNRDSRKNFLTTAFASWCLLCLISLLMAKQLTHSHTHTLTLTHSHTQHFWWAQVSQGDVYLGLQWAWMWQDRRDSKARNRQTHPETWIYPKETDEPFTARECLLNNCYCLLNS